MTASDTPIYAPGDKTSFNTRNPSMFARTIDTAPNRAIVFPSSTAVKTWSCPNIVMILIRK